VIQIPPAFHSRNYRLYFLGQMISLFGTWMTTTATSWLAYRLSRSTVVLGVMSCAATIPTLALGPIAGAFIDRADRRRLLLITGLLSLSNASVLAWMTLTGRVSLVAMGVSTLVQGAVTAFDMPGRLAFMADIVEGRDAASNAIAVNGALFSASRVAGPAVAGALIAGLGEGVCFAVDAISYGASILSLRAMHVSARSPRRERAQSLLAHCRSGCAYIAGAGWIRDVMIASTVLTCSTFPFSVLMPVFAVQRLHGGPQTLGALLAAFGCGGTVGAVWLAMHRRAPDSYPIVIAGSSALCGCALIMLSLIDAHWPAVACIFSAGMAMVVQVQASTALIQVVAHDEWRGTVMSWRTTTVIGSFSIGSLIVTRLAAAGGLTFALSACGTSALLATAWFLHRVRRMGAVAREETSVGVLG